MMECFKNIFLAKFVCVAVVVIFSPQIARCNDDASFDGLEKEYQKQTLPLLKQFCLECHSTKAKEGELDLERFGTLDAVRRDPPAWQKVAEMLDTREMPPEDSPQLSKQQRKQLRGWVRKYLNAEARAGAGDPGPVVLRRLNNAEYTYTVRDLTGVDLNPAAEFPVDGAAGEGFTNTGNALVMSPALITKYLDAGKEIAGHAVLLPDGFRFFQGETRRDWTNEIIRDIRQVYLRHTGRQADVNSLNRWNHAQAMKLTNLDGRVDLVRYLDALIRNRTRLLKDIAAANDIAKQERLSAKYLRLLAHMLVSEKPGSLLLGQIRNRWRKAVPQDAPVIAAEIRAWQDRLWKFNIVGHFGQVKGWQEAASPLSESQSFRVKIEPKAKSDDVTLFLIAGSAGDGTVSDVVAWENPRIERAGRRPIPLRDVRAISIALDKTQKKLPREASKYLAAAFDARTNGKKRSLIELAAAHGVDPVLLKPWLSYLGISHAGELKIKQYLHLPLKQTGGYNFVKGWGLPGASALSVVSNSSDDKVNVPGEMPPHKVAVHPRPERWVAAGWKSPIDGLVRLAPSIKDAHAACGNGVSWSFELRRGGQRRVLEAGNIDLGGAATIKPRDKFSVKKGDLLSLVIGPRDGNHGCDLTEIDLVVTEQAGAKQTWSLSADCADSIHASNPHDDRLGNKDVWHFYTDTLAGTGEPSTIPPNSLLARWLETEDALVAAKIASEIQLLVSKPLLANASAADAEIHRQLTALDGPLFSLIDTAELARRVSSEELKATKYGLDSHLFGRHPDGTAVSPEHLVVQAPSIIEITLPAKLVAGSELVTSAKLHDPAAQQGSVQLQVTSVRPTAADVLLPGIPIVVRDGSQADARFRQSFDQFRQLFPSAMCYPKIVPVDEVVTLVLYYREDHELARLMLDNEEKKKLDRLWDELHYVSRDALTIVTAFEQLMEFATQDNDPSKFAPLGKPINAQAAAFRKRLVKSEPAHLEALIAFASRAYRRSLTERETRGVHGLYQTLRQQELPHEDAFRLTLARVLTSPAFLYRLEQSSPTEKQSPVSNEELAGRLSYFLWSTMPDAELRRTASAGQLRNSKMLLKQTRRMLKDPRMRRMAIEFACQWLHIRDFDQFDEKNERLFPQFAELRGDMYEESIRFFEDIFRSDRSILDILDADHTFLNERLAKHYGIPGVQGDHWRLVKGVKEFSRGGILALSTTLAKQSGASRTSLILRGNWVSETLLGERLPRPPKGVPVLPEVVPAGLTERQLIEKHSSLPGCVNCHKRVDPYGFTLEGFDTIGRFRTKDGGDHPIDTRATLMDGTKIEGINGLRNYLLTTRHNTVVRQFCRKLLGYALGRSVRLSDEPLLSKMAEDLQKHDYRFSAAIEAIVLSRQFREIRGNGFGRVTGAKP